MFQLQKILGVLFCLSVLSEWRVQAAENKCELPGFQLDAITRYTWAISPEVASCPDSEKPCMIILSVCSHSVFCPDTQQVCLAQNGQSENLGSSPVFAENPSGFSITYAKETNHSHAIIEVECDSSKHLETIDSQLLGRLDAEVHKLEEGYRILIKSSIACKHEGLGFGAQFAILLICCSLIYLGGGVAYNHVNGARGLELIPHYWFWSNFSTHVVDGCVFTVRLITCQTTSNYSQASDYGSTGAAGLSPSGRTYENL